MLRNALHLTDAAVYIFIMLVYQSVLMEGKAAYNSLVFS